MTQEAARALAQFFQQMADEHPPAPAPAKSERSGNPDWARLTVAAGELGICERTLDRWGQDGTITIYRKGRIKFIDRSELKRALTTRTDSAPASPEAWAKKKLGK